MHNFQEGQNGNFWPRVRSTSGQHAILTRVKIINGKKLLFFIEHEILFNLLWAYETNFIQYLCNAAF